MRRLAPRCERELIDIWPHGEVHTHGETHTQRLATDHTDVRNRRCWSPGCGRRALYGVGGTARLGAHSCHRHRRPDEKVLGGAKRLCSDANCSRVATFGAPGQATALRGSRELRCAQHRDVGDVDLRNRLCAAVMM